ncbi:MAG: hypothetical protein DDT22_01352 [candidate division WS2 bacterium]|nr:hypothetical protein [Candidatus Lithacetigena glycinireducens]
MELVCKYCGLCQDTLTTKIKKHYLPNGGYHLKAFCSNCERFIKNIPYSLPKILHFGKYKSKPIAVVAKENPAYLRWLCSQDIKDNLKQSIKLELEKLENVNAQECLKIS